MVKNGFTFVEVLVSLLILMVGVLGIAGLQAGTLKNNVSASYQTHAAVLVNDMADKIRRNRWDAMSGKYNLAFNATVADTTSVAGVDINNWLNRINAKLPSGGGYVYCDSQGLCEISVRWDDPVADGGTRVTRIVTRV